MPDYVNNVLRLFSGLLLLLTLTSCTPTPPKQQHTTPNSPKAYGYAVANWQLDTFDDLSYLPTFRDDSEYTRGWIKATFYLGLERFARVTGKQEYYDELARVSRQNGFDLGRQPWHADDQAITAMYARIAQRINRADMMKHVIDEFDSILENRATHGLEFVQGTVSEGGCQRRWCWADALFMGPPAWAELARLTSEERYLEYAVSEAKATIEYLQDPESHLFFRDSRYFDMRTTNGHKVFWSRGNGWVIAGLARFIETIPADHPERKYFISSYQNMASSLISIQRKDGYWATSLHDPELFTNPETSGTGLIGFALAWGLNNNVLHGKEYEDAVNRAWAAMIAAIDEDGRLGWVQQVGKDPKSTTKESSQIYASGAFLLMASEMTKRD